MPVPCFSGHFPAQSPPAGLRECTRWPSSAQTRPTLHRHLPFVCGLALLGFVLLQACHVQPWTGFPTPTDSRLLWPAPPERARIAYVMQITKCGDLFGAGGLWSALKNWIAGPEDTSMVRPFALALHPWGGLLVADPGRRVVHFFCWGRQCYTALGPKRPGGLPSPVGVAALPDGRVLVSDSRLQTVEAFDPEGAWLGAFVSAGKIGRPAGLAVNAQRGEVYVCDVTGHRIVALDLLGRPVRVIGRRGEGPSEFNYPTHLAVAPDGRLAIADSMNFRVQILDPDGRFVSSFGRLGDSPGSFSKMKGIAVDSNNRVLAVEGLYDAVEIFGPQGEFLFSLGRSGANPGEFWLPAGLAFDRQDNLLFVADSYNKRVQVFRMLQEVAP